MSFIDPSLQRLAARRVDPDDASQRVGHAFDLVLDVKHIAVARRIRPSLLLSCAQPTARVGNGELGIQPLRAGLQQMHAPSVGVTMLDRFKKIAVRRGRIDTGEHRLAALEDLVMQAHFNRRQIDDAVDDARQLGGTPRARCARCPR